MSAQHIDLVKWHKAGRPMINGWPVMTKESSEKSDKDDKKKETVHKFHYVTRSGAAPHPPVITNDDPAKIVHPQPHYPAVSTPVYYMPPTPAVTAFKYAYGFPQYSYPYTYAMSPAVPTPFYTTGGYYGYPAMTYAAPVPEKKKEKKKDKKQKVTHHNWYGRTAHEAAWDDAITASKSGANKPKEIKPDAKPGDQFWVIDTNGARFLRSFFEIENAHKPGKWVINPTGGNLFFQKEKEEKKDESSSSSSSDSDSDGGWFNAK